MDMFAAAKHNLHLVQNQCALPMAKEEEAKLTSETRKLLETKIGQAYSAFASIRRIDDSLKCYHAHLIRHVNSSGFADFMLTHLGVGSCVQAFVLDDFWAKQGPQCRIIICCDQGKSERSTSVFGRVARFKNPELAERAQYSDVDWSKYPKPPSDGGPAFLRVAMRALSDTSNQSATHTGATRAVLDRRLLQLHPWLEKKGESSDADTSPGGYGQQSDGAGNFLGKAAIRENYLNELILYNSISEAGMGKNVVDGDNAAMQAIIREHMRGEGEDLDGANPYFRLFERKKHERQLKGHDNSIHDLSQVAAPKSIATKIGKHFKFQVFERGHKHVRLFEQFDLDQSQELGYPVGFGKGKVVTEDELEITEEMRREREASIAGVHVDPESDIAGNLTPSAVAPALSLEQKSQMRQNKVAKQQTRRERRAFVAEQKKAWNERVTSMHVRKDLAYRCDSCEAMFLTATGLDNHVIQRDANEGNCTGRMADMAKHREELRANQVRSRIDAHCTEIIGERIEAEEIGLDVVSVEIPPITVPRRRGTGLRAVEDALGLTLYESPLDGAPSAVSVFPDDDWKPLRKEILKTIKADEKLWVRVPSAFYPEISRFLWGIDWRSHFFYGYIQKSPESTPRKPTCHLYYRRHWVDDELADDDHFHPSEELGLGSEHFGRSWLLRPSNRGDDLPPPDLLDKHTSTNRACVLVVARGSPASAKLIQRGWLVEDVLYDGDGEEHPIVCLKDVRTALAKAVHSGKPFRIVFRRVPPPLPEIGFARELKRKYPKVLTDPLIVLKLYSKSQEASFAGRARKLYDHVLKDEEAEFETNYRDFLPEDDESQTHSKKATLTSILPDDVLCTKLQLVTPARRSVKSWVSKWYKEYKAKLKKPAGEAASELAAPRVGPIIDETCDDDMDEGEDDDTVDDLSDAEEELQSTVCSKFGLLPTGTRVKKTIRVGEGKNAVDQWFSGFIIKFKKIQGHDGMGVLFDDGDYVEYKLEDLNDENTVVEPEYDSPPPQLLNALELTYPRLCALTGRFVFSSDVVEEMGPIIQLRCQHLAHKERPAAVKRIAPILARRLLAVEFASKAMQEQSHLKK